MPPRRLSQFMKGRQPAGTRSTSSPCIGMGKLRHVDGRVPAGKLPPGDLCPLPVAAVADRVRSRQLVDQHLSDGEPAGFLRHRRHIHAGDAVLMCSVTRGSRCRSNSPTATLACTTVARWPRRSAWRIVPSTQRERRASKALKRLERLPCPDAAATSPTSAFGVFALAAGRRPG